MSQTNPEADVNPWAARYIDLLNEKYFDKKLVGWKESTFYVTSIHVQTLFFYV